MIHLHSFFKGTFHMRPMMRGAGRPAECPSTRSTAPCPCPRARWAPPALSVLAMRPSPSLPCLPSLRAYRHRLHQHWSRPKPRGIAFTLLTTSRRQRARRGGSVMDAGMDPKPVANHCAFDAHKAATSTFVAPVGTNADHSIESGSYTF